MAGYLLGRFWAKKFWLGIYSKNSEIVWLGIYSVDFGEKNFGWVFTQEKLFSQTHKGHKHSRDRAFDVSLLYILECSEYEEFRC